MISVFLALCTVSGFEVRKFVFSSRNDETYHCRKKRDCDFSAQFANVAKLCAADVAADPKTCSSDCLASANEVKRSCLDAQLNCLEMPTTDGSLTTHQMTILTSMGELPCNACGLASFFSVVVAAVLVMCSS